MDTATRRTGGAAGLLLSLVEVTAAGLGLELVLVSLWWLFRLFDAAAMRFETEDRFAISTEARVGVDMSSSTAVLMLKPQHSM